MPSSNITIIGSVVMFNLSSEGILQTDFQIYAQTKATGHMTTVCIVMETMILVLIIFILWCKRQFQLRAVHENFVCDQF